ncbi:hypothetical protein AVEN_160523-1 [Araneus ventricosus]|uniref:Uncharacterized protein n=1 Tax=Araneus ventricosus TaxID=182803 RepID=A0A4Y2B3I1_ARAVE|nr:hypothetical protein AVEN_160523-1 [Araneus ventricosus]
MWLRNSKSAKVFHSMTSKQRRGLARIQSRESTACEISSSVNSGEPPPAFTATPRHRQVDAAIRRGSHPCPKNPYFTKMKKNIQPQTQRCRNIRREDRKCELFLEGNIPFQLSFETFKSQKDINRQIPLPFILCIAKPKFHVI